MSKPHVISLRLPDDLLERLDRLVGVPASRTPTGGHNRNQLMRSLIEDGLQRLERQESSQSPRPSDPRRGTRELLHQWSMEAEALEARADEHKDRDIATRQKLMAEELRRRAIELRQALKSTE